MVAFFSGAFAGIAYFGLLLVVIYMCRAGAEADKDRIIKLREQ